MLSGWTMTCFQEEFVHIINLRRPRISPRSTFVLQFFFLFIILFWLNIIDKFLIINNHYCFLSIIILEVWMWKNWKSVPLNTNFFFFYLYSYSNSSDFLILIFQETNKSIFTYVNKVGFQLFGLYNRVTRTRLSLKPDSVRLAAAWWVT